MIINKKVFNRGKCYALAISLGSLAALPMHVVAQAADASAESEAEKVDVERISVTSSRITSHHGYEAPTPTLVVDVEGLQDGAQVNIANTLNQMPAMGRATSPRTAGTAVGGGTQGANFLNLRGLGSNRTLVLLDGRRFVASQATGQVDFNMLPTALAKSVDIVSGGASAAWGSDAVAGVINVVLDKNYEGLKVSAQTGISEQGDGEEIKTTIAGGLSFDENRGHILGSFTYVNSADAGEIGDRSWFRGTKSVRDNAAEAAATDPNTIRWLILDNVGLNNAYHGGVIVDSKGNNPSQYFKPDGSLGTWDENGQTYTNGLFAQGGSAIELGNDQAEYMDVTASYEQTTAFARIAYDISDNLNVYSEFNYGYSVADTGSSAYRFNGSRKMTIKADNAYLAEIGMPAEQIYLGHTNTQFGGVNPHNERTVQRIVIGGDYMFDNDWSSAFYYQYGDSEIINTVRNDPIKSKYALAIDAVYDENDNIVCRSSLTDPTNGCSPLNVFGVGNMSEEAMDWIRGTAVQVIDITQDVFSISFSGDLYELPAGPISAAFGFDYREETFQASADEISIDNGFWLGNYKPSDKKGYDVNEFFAEILVPVFVDSDFGNSLDWNAAVRSTDYSYSGRVTTWKTGLTYDIGAGVKLRSTVSRDIRAPNLSDLFLGGSVRTQTVTNNVTGNSDVLFTVTSGNDNLVPEESDTKTIGIVYQPDYIEGFNMSLDYFEIELTNAISNLSNSDIVDGCQLQGIQERCDLLTFDNTGTITQLSNKPLNFAAEYFSSYDMEIGYRFDAMGGQFSLRSLVSYAVEHYTVGSGGAIDNMLGEYAASGPRRIKALNTVGFKTDDWKFSLRHRYDHSGVMDADFIESDEVVEGKTSINLNSVPSMSYFDFTATTRVEVNDVNLEIFGTVENLFDKEPPRVTGFRNVATELGTANDHDIIGRYFRVGVRAEF